VRKYDRNFALETQYILSEAYHLGDMLLILLKKKEKKNPEEYERNVAFNGISPKFRKASVFIASLLAEISDGAARRERALVSAPSSHFCHAVRDLC